MALHQHLYREISSKAKGWVAQMLDLGLPTTPVYCRIICSDSKREKGFGWWSKEPCKRAENLGRGDETKIGIKDRGERGIWPWLDVWIAIIFVKRKNYPKSWNFTLFKAFFKISYYPIYKNNTIDTDGRFKILIIHKKRKMAAISRRVS